MRTTLLLLLAALPAAAADRDASWPEFRGPTGDGHARASGLPVRWSETDNVRWKTPIHDKGWSSPVVWGDQVWLTTATADGKRMYAVAIERGTGKVVYDIKLFDVAKPQWAPDENSYASPTPAIEAGRVYVHFGSYGTACLDTVTGKVVWARRDLPCNHWRGPASSPILFENLLILTFDGYDYQYVTALDKTTGKTVWRADRTIRYGTDNGDLKKAFATPTVIEVGGRPQLISPAAVATTAYDPRTGRELWRVYHGGMNAAERPVFGAGHVFLTSGDGGLNLIAVRPDGQGDVTRTHLDWKTNRNVPHRASPVLVGDYLYMANDGGVASCLDARTGTPVWQRRLGGQFWASPIYADGRLYFANAGGETFVIEPGRACKVLAVNRLDDGCMASPAAVGRSLFLRTKTHLYCLEQK
jgi:outer membrane protein assembly factor BamB